MNKTRAPLWIASLLFASLGGSQTSRAAEPAAAPANAIGWHEAFDHPPLDWVDPVNQSAANIAQVYSIAHEGTLSFLHARHDRATQKNPPAVHYGKAFLQNQIPLEKARVLRWRWRALQHPNIGKDPWEDLAASVYVLIRKPSLFHGGRGFKFGWLTKPGEPAHQHGLLEVPLRGEPASQAWKSESVDLCALYKQEYKAPCEGEKILYVGVVTDADNTRSIASGDYADFAIEVAP